MITIILANLADVAGLQHFLGQFLLVGGHKPFPKLSQQLPGLQVPGNGVVQHLQDVRSNLQPQGQPSLPINGLSTDEGKVGNWGGSFSHLSCLVLQLIYHSWNRETESEVE